MLNLARLKPRGIRPPNLLGGMEVIVMPRLGEVEIVCDNRRIKTAAGEVVAISLGAGADFGLSNPTSCKAEILEIWLSLEQWLGHPVLRRARSNQNRIVASGISGDDPALRLEAPVRVELLATAAGEDLQLHLRGLKIGYICALAGEASVDGHKLRPHDALAFADQPPMALHVHECSECLLIAQHV